MICPECNAEFLPGVRRCPDCGVDLIDAQPAADHEVDLVTVFTGGDQAQIAVAKSLLESADIPFMTLNEGVQDLFALGRLPFGDNVATGPVEIRVGREDAADALAILKDMDAPVEPDDDADPGDDPGGGP